MLTVERVALSRLLTDPSNVRTHDDRNLEAIAASLARFGQVEPLVVQASSMRVVGGNGRLAAMQKLGWSEASVVLLEIDDVAAAALSIALNRTGELAGWDMAALEKTLVALREEGLMDAAGFSERELREVQREVQESLDSLNLEDAGPEEPPEKPVSRSGDLWELGAHRLLCGDATSSADVERLLAGGEPGLMVTDPPYGVNYDPVLRKEATRSKSKRTGKVANDDRADWSAAYALFPGRVAYVWHSALFAGVVMDGLAGAGLRPRSQIVWAKPVLVLSRAHYHWQHEPAIYAVQQGADPRWSGVAAEEHFALEHQVAAYAAREGAPAEWIGGRKQSTVWMIDGPQRGQDAQTVHGTQKPVECMARPMRNHDFPSVYEPFSGSGTTIVAAERLRRQCYAMEIDPRYVDVAVLRWEALTKQKALCQGKGYAEWRAARSA